MRPIWDPQTLWQFGHVLSDGKSGPVLLVWATAWSFRRALFSSSLLSVLSFEMLRSLPQTLPPSGVVQAVVSRELVLMLHFFMLALRMSLKCFLVLQEGTTPIFTECVPLSHFLHRCYFEAGFEFNYDTQLTPETCKGILAKSPISHVSKVPLK